MHVRWTGSNPWSLPQFSDLSVFRLQTSTIASLFEILQTPGHWMLTRNSYVKVVCSGANVLHPGFNLERTEQIFTLLLAALPVVHLSSGWRSWILLLGGPQAGGSVVFAASISSMFLQANVIKKWLFPLPRLSAVMPPRCVADWERAQEAVSAAGDRPRGYYTKCPNQGTTWAFWLQTEGSSRFQFLSTFWVYHFRKKKAILGMSCSGYRDSDIAAASM